MTEKSFDALMTGMVLFILAMCLTFLAFIIIATYKFAVAP